MTFLSQAFLTRAGAAVAMAIILALLISLGHHAISVAVFFLEGAVFRELLNVRHKEAKEKEVPWYFLIHWSIFLVGTFYLHGHTSMRNLLWLYPELFTNLLHYHTYISVVAYALVFVMFVLSLRKGVVKYQIGQIAWSILIMFMVVFQTRAVIYNIFNGIFWFLFPASLVIINDTSAYFFGKALGKKIIGSQFLALSPNKTWEGFIGGGLSTIVFGFFFSRWLGSLSYFACPYGQPHCSLHRIFVPTSQTISFLTLFTTHDTFNIAPIQYHAVLMACFASLVAPFGGFFASAIKRAYDLKDFASVIPGHGGFMDRVDCQFIMAFYVWVHCNTFITTSTTSIIGTLLVLAPQYQADFMSQFKNHLISQGLLLTS